MSTFNSLSRDHMEKVLQNARYGSPLSTPSLGITEEIAELVSREIVRLSTPSLGITRGDFARLIMRPDAYFQLPLSGSPFLSLISNLVQSSAYFQLPLSGSLNRAEQQPQSPP